MPKGPKSHKIKRLGAEAEKLVNRLRAEGKGYRAIANEVEEVFDVSVSHTAVQNYLKEEVDTRAQRLGVEEMRKLEKRKAEKVLEVESQIQEINEKLQKAINSLDETNRADIDQLVSLAKEVRNQLRFQKKYLEQISQPDTEIDLSKTEVAIKISNKLSELEKNGIIKILKPEKVSLTEEND